jgi:hypothetical protein
VSQGRAPLSQTESAKDSGHYLAQVLDDGDNLRVIPIVTYGAASNLDDLLYLRYVDVAVTQADVFEYFRTQRKTRK